LEEAEEEEEQAKPEWEEKGKKDFILQGIELRRAPLPR